MSNTHGFTETESHLLLVKAILSLGISSLQISSALLAALALLFTCMHVCKPSVQVHLGAISLAYLSQSLAGTWDLLFSLGG